MLLIDCGSGVLARYLEIGVLPDLTALLLSHLHSDHMSDAAVYRYYLSWNKLRCDLWMPGGDSPERLILSVPQYNVNNMKAGVAGGDAGGVTEAVAGVGAPLGVLLREEGGEGGGEGLGEVTDMGDNFVVLGGGDDNGVCAESAPEGAEIFDFRFSIFDWALPRRCVFG